MKNYWLIHLGQGNKYATAAYAEKCIAVGWNELDLDLSSFLKLEKRDFVKEIAPLLKEVIPDRTSKYYEGSARQLHKFSSLMQTDDIVLMPSEEVSSIYVGEVKSGYYYAPRNEQFPFRHRRNVIWIATLERSEFSQQLKNSAGSILTLFSLNPHTEEIETLLASKTETKFLGTEDAKDFGLESHLEEFIVENWEHIPEFRDYEIYKEDDQVVGQQYNTTIGRIDILARGKKGRSWLVIELKKGKTSDDVIGQTLRYIGWVMENEADAGDAVTGLVIAGKNDERLRLALKTVPHVEFMTYEVRFSLRKEAQDIKKASSTFS